MASRRSMWSGSWSRARSALLSLLLAGCAAPAAPPPAPPSNTPQPVLDVGSLARRTHDEINRARAREGRAPLAWDETLVALAVRHSEDMARRDFFAHSNPDGDDVNARAQALGLECRYSVGNLNYSGFAENLFQSHRYSGYTRETTASGTRTAYDWLDEGALAEQAVREWLGSPGHRRTLLNAQHRRHAVGIAFSDRDEVYFTDVFC